MDVIRFEKQINTCLQNVQIVFSYFEKSIVLARSNGYVASTIALVVPNGKINIRIGQQNQHGLSSFGLLCSQV